MDNQSTLVSVVMPVYNGELYLEEAIESVLNQTYKNFEFIIINDGSTDKSLEIIKQFQKEDNRIVLINRENKGLVYSLNEGIIIAKGKYIARMDADDISLPNRFEEQIKFMEENTDIGVCGTWVEVFGKNKKPTIWKLPISHNELKTRLLFSVPVAHPSAMIRKNIIDKYNLKYKKEYTHVEDYAFWTELSNYAKLSNLPKVLLKYRYVETSVSRIADKAKDNSRYKTIKSIFTELLYQLNISNTEQENRLHFVIGLNERISKENIDLKVLDDYLNKILEANKQTKVFDEKYLENFLAKKFLVCSYYSFKQNRFQLSNILKNKLFYLGIVDYIKGKLN